MVDQSRSKGFRRSPGLQYVVANKATRHDIVMNVREARSPRQQAPAPAALAKAARQRWRSPGDADGTRGAAGA